MATQPRQRPQVQEEPEEQEEPQGRFQDYESALDRPSDEIAAPIILPVGTYTWMIVGLPVEGVSSQKGTPQSDYTLQCMEAHGDVSQEALEKALTKPNGEVMPLNSKTMKQTFYNTDNAIFMHKDFLTSLGIPLEDDDGNVLSTRERLAQAPGKLVKAKVRHQPRQDGSGMRASLANFMPV
jgi:hypothetical protein